MRHSRRSAAALFSLLTLVLLLTGCPKRPATTDMSAPAPSGTQPSATAPTGSPPNPAASSPPSPAASSPSSPGARSPSVPSTSTPRPSEFVATEHLKDIHFDFDRYDIRSGDAKILDANAAWLKAHQGDLILIEGHCDERGTSEYNVALGERRAKAAMRYLTGQGVQASRITLISYGKERPGCTEHTEVCWARNRRAHFLVKAK